MTMSPLATASANAATTVALPAFDSLTSVSRLGKRAITIPIGMGREREEDRLPAAPWET